MENDSELNPNPVDPSGSNGSEKTPETEVAPEKSIRPVQGANPDLKAVIDEAVEAVESVTRRREDGEADDDGDLGPDDAGQLRSEVAMLRDRLLRTLADFDNYRKRVERERSDERKYAVVEPLRDVLGIVDNLDRALAAEGGLEDLRQGVEMILRQMGDFLRRFGVEAVEAMGQPFDPAIHEAVSRVEDPEAETPMVVDEMQRGYTVYDRLLRPSVVKVAMPVEAPVDGPADDGGSDREDS